MKSGDLVHPKCKADDDCKAGQTCLQGWGEMKGRGPCFGLCPDGDCKYEDFQKCWFVPGPYKKRICVLPCNEVNCPSQLGRQCWNWNLKYSENICF